MTDPIPDDERPGLPKLRTWPAVYAFVLVSFVAMVALLGAFTAWFAR